MSDIRFHSLQESAYLWTAQHVADEKGVSYDIVPIVYRSPEHLALHPFGKMPVMQHGDFFLYETAAIAHYIDRRFAGPPLQPSSPRDQAEVIRWISVINSYVFPTMNRFMKERLVRPAMGIEPDQAFIDSAEESLKLQMRLIEEAVSDTPFLAGESLTIADSFLLPHLLFFGRTPEGEALLAKSRAASAWLDRMRARPSFHGSISRTYEAFAFFPPARSAGRRNS